MTELHEERTDLPNWDTKVHCTCGFESVSRAGYWKHAADELRSVVGTFDLCPTCHLITNTYQQGLPDD